MTGVEWLALVAAGAVGAVTRSLAATAGARRSFPWATLAVNTAGAFVLGLVAGAGSTTRLVVGTGFCGAVTTFSTFAVEANRLPVARSALYVTATLVGGLAAAAAGLALG